MLSLDPDFLRSFLAICDTGSYGAAAERVNKTQSTISAQMKRLEETLGVGLFEKTGRRNVLSPAGRQLLEYARLIVRLNDQTVNAFRAPEVRGAIKIGTSDDYAQIFLAPILNRFAYTHPAVEVEIVTADSAELMRRNDAESFDAMLISRDRPDLNVELELLRTDRLHWIGSARHNHDDERLPLALWSDGCSWRAKALAALAAAGRQYRLVFTTSNAPLLMQTVRDGRGVTIGPRWYLAEGMKVLDDLDAACPLGEDGVGIYVRPGAESQQLDVFLDQVRTQFRHDAARTAA